MKEELSMEQDQDKESQTPGPNGGTTSPGIEDQVDALNAEVGEISREKDQFKQMFLRAQADFINYKKRVEEDREELEKYASSRLILKLLPAMDEFRLAIDHASESDADSSWLQGIKLIQRKLNSVLESEVVTRIEAEGREFDPLEHEAMGYSESSDHDEGQVVSVVRDGYKMHDRVIRPAMVILAKPPGSAPDESGPDREKESDNA